MNNFYLIDKPLGITSFDVIRKLRKITGIKKMGHTGTLDPLASGCLLIAIGEYTKLIPYFENDTKEYEFCIKLDGESASYDLGEKVLFLSQEKQIFFKEKLTKRYLENIIKQNFIGIIDQIPPKYSALKIGGKKALEMVKSGENFTMKNRKVTIFNIDVLYYSYPELKIKAKVSAGTYIRSIAYDLGKILGTGGYISSLRRIKIGELDIGDSIKLDDFDFKKCLNEKNIFNEKRLIQLPEDILRDLNNGKVTNYSLNKPFGIYFIIDDFGKIINVVDYNNLILTPKRKII